MDFSWCYDGTYERLIDSMYAFFHLLNLCHIHCSVLYLKKESCGQEKGIRKRLLALTLKMNFLGKEFTRAGRGYNMHHMDKTFSISFFYKHCQNMY